MGYDRFDCSKKFRNVECILINLNCTGRENAELWIISQINNSVTKGRCVDTVYIQGFLRYLEVLQTHNWVFHCGMETQRH